MEQKTRKKRFRRTFGAVALVGLASTLWNGYKGGEMIIRREWRPVSSDVKRYEQLSRDKNILEEALKIEEGEEQLCKAGRNLEPSVYIQGYGEAIRKQLEDLSIESDQLYAKNKEQIDERNANFNKGNFHFLAIFGSVIPALGGYLAWTVRRRQEND